MSTDNENEEEDFDFDEEGDEGFDDFQTESSSLGDAWRNNPVVKIFAVLVIFGAIIGGITLFGGEGEVPISATPPPPDVTQAPGAEVSPEYQRAVEERNIAERETAEREGGSAIPVPVGAPRELRNEQRDERNQDDGLARWREIQAQRLAEQQEQRQQARRQQQEQLFQRQVQAEQQQQTDQVINELAEAMQGQMESIIAEQQPQEFETLEVTNLADYIDFKRSQLEKISGESVQSGSGGAQNMNNQASLTNNAQARIGQSGQGGTSADVIIPAGKIEYGQLLLEANTDAPGPVLAQVVSGPFKGARMLGNFEAQRDFLTLQFSTMSYDDQTIAIQAVAINPETSTPGIVTEIDRRYISRVVLPTAAAFIQGFGEAVAEAGNTTVTVEDGTAIEEEEDLDTREELFSAAADAGDVLSELVQEEAQEIRPLLRIDAGTPIGVLFLTPVLDPETAPEQGFGGVYGQGYGAGGFGGQGLPGQMPAGQRVPGHAGLNQFGQPTAAINPFTGQPMQAPQQDTGGPFISPFGNPVNPQQGNFQ